MSEVPFTSPPETLPQCHFPDPAAPPAGSVPDLSGWFHALEGARAPSAGASQVIPLGFGGPGSVDDAAWLGDKHLGIAVADVLVAHGVHGKEDLTRPPALCARVKCEHGTAYDRDLARPPHCTAPIAGRLRVADARLRHDSGSLRALRA